MSFNLMINKSCNLGCPYCFADSIVNKGIGNITISDFNYFIKFMKNSGERSITIMGGEPTLHPDFLLFIQTIIDGGFSVMILTNGTFNKKVKDYLLKINSDKLSLCFNINKYEKESLFHISRDNLKQLSQNSVLSVNIDSVDFDFDFYINLIDKTSVKTVRWSYTLPGMSNNFLRIEDYAKVNKLLVLFFRNLIKRGVHIVSDHLTTICSFTKEDIQYMNDNGIKLKTKCEPVIDVLPDLSLINCFPLFGKLSTLSLKDFTTTDEVIAKYDSELKKVIAFTAPGECRTCEAFKIGYCSGGCTALRL